MVVTRGVMGRVACEYLYTVYTVHVAIPSWSHDAALGHQRTLSAMS